MHPSVVAAASAAVQECQSADEAVEAVAVTLPETLEVSRVAIRMRRSAYNDVMILATWSKGPPLMAVGLTHPTKGALGELYDRIVRHGRADIYEIGEGVAPAAEQILFEAGNRSTVQIPLVDHSVRGVLAIYSAHHGAFSDEHLPMYELLGREIGPHALKLGEEAMSRLGEGSLMA